MKKTMQAFPRQKTYLAGGHRGTMNWLEKISTKDNDDSVRICPECYALHDDRYKDTGYCTNCGAKIENKEEET